MTPESGTEPKSVDADEVVDAEIVEDEPQPELRRITGRDGKNYTRPRDSKPRRPSLTDPYRNTIWDLDKTVRKLEAFHTDDRFNSNRGALSDHVALLAEISGRIQILAEQLGEQRNGAPSTPKA